MEKRVVFRSRWLPYALVAPQLAITIVFFFWPAAQALVPVAASSRTRSALTVEFVGFDNFVELFATTRTTSRRSGSRRCSRCWSRSLGLSISLVLAVFADRAIRGAGVYKTLLIWPYAVAPAVAAVLWLFLFNPTLGVVAHWMQGLGIALGSAARRQRRADRSSSSPRSGSRSRYNFLFFLAGLQSIPKSLIEAAAIDGAGPGRRFCDDRVPAAVADDVLPARRQHRLRVLRHVRDHRRGDRRRPGSGDRDPRLQGLQGRLQGRSTSAARPRSRWC